MDLSKLTSSLDNTAQIDGTIENGLQVASTISNVTQVGSTMSGLSVVRISYDGSETDSIIVTVDNNSGTIVAQLQQVQYASHEEFPKDGSSRLLYVSLEDGSLWFYDSAEATYKKISGDNEDNVTEEFVTNLLKNYTTTAELQKMYATNERVDEVENIAKGANQAVSFENYSAMIAALNTLGNSVYNVGQNIMIVTLEVPDLWVSGTIETSVAYSYTSDDDFVSDLKANGSVQVGHYILSALETQKVDLTEYEKSSDVDTKISKALEQVDLSLESKVDNEDGKGLSSNDFTDEYISRIETLENSIPTVTRLV